MSDVRRHRRRWRNKAAWMFAFFPWAFPLAVAIVRKMMGDDLDGKFVGMVILCCVYTGLVFIGWEPWKKED